MILLSQTGKSETAAREIFRGVNPLYSTPTVRERVTDKDGWDQFVSTSSPMDIAAERIHMCLRVTYPHYEWSVTAKDLAVIIGESLDLTRQAADKLVREGKIKKTDGVHYWQPI